MTIHRLPCGEELGQLQPSLPTKALWARESAAGSHISLPTSAQEKIQSKLLGMWSFHNTGHCEAASVSWDSAGGPGDAGPSLTMCMCPGTWAAKEGEHSWGLPAPTNRKLNATKVTLTPTIIPWEILLDQSPKMPSNQLMFLIDLI